jgi:hypothetical protein
VGGSLGRVETCLWKSLWTVGQEVHGQHEAFYLVLEISLESFMPGGYTPKKESPPKKKPFHRESFFLEGIQQSMLFPSLIFPGLWALTYSTGKEKETPWTPLSTSIRMPSCLNLS